MAVPLAGLALVVSVCLLGVGPTLALAATAAAARAVTTRVQNRAAERANRENENIGARRLHTIMEALLDELSFTASERVEREASLDEPDVRRVLAPILADKDLARFIL